MADDRGTTTVPLVVVLLALIVGFAVYILVTGVPA